MAKIRNNLVLQGVSGMLGSQLVVRRRRDGSFILASAPHGSDRAPTESQAAHQKEFQDAARYAKDAQKSPEYKAVAKTRGLSAFNVALADFMQPPEIKSVDASAYTGEAGQSITINATDDVRVAQVGVLISTPSGDLVEKGEAKLGDSGTWIYTTTAKAPAGKRQILISAADLSGHTVTQTATQ